MKMQLALASLILFLLASSTSSQVSSGPTHGTLTVTGGEVGSGVREKFVSLAGGSDANFVYIPTAFSSIKLDSGLIYTPPVFDLKARSVLSAPSSQIR